MATQLLNDDGTASMATMVMTSHHAFRRDLDSFARALAGAHDTEVLRETWGFFRAALHGHHTVEDTAIFPDLKTRMPETTRDIEKLEAQHHAIDPLLDRGDRVFAAADVAGARELIAELQRHLAEHLDLEERVVIPHLRGAKEFPAPPNEEALGQYADGFAWSTAGLAPNVYEKICAMLPAALVAKLPAAREAFDARCRRAWGYVHTGTSTTSVPAA